MDKYLRDRIEKQEPRRGLLIAFEGLDGAGKTTQRKLFKEWLKSAGYEVFTTRWNSSPLIKPLLSIRKEARSLSPEEYCLLHAADMHHRLENGILEALWEGKIVVADRWFFTALARDGARGLPFDWLLNVYAPLFWPDAVFYFSVSLETAGKRLFAMRPPKFYEAGQDFTGVDDPFESYKVFVRRVHHEYENLSLIFQFITIDAEESIFDQHQRIRQLFNHCRRRPWADWNGEVLAEWLAGRRENGKAQSG